MAAIRVSPETFEFVDYDAAEIAAIAGKLADEIGFATDEVVEIEIDERTPLNRMHVVSIDSPVHVLIEGGAIEDPTAPRELSPRLAAESIGRLLLKVADRRTGGFEGAPADDELSLQQTTAWDAYCMGRLDRLGYDVRQPRRRYHFRTRHGFSDAADTVFDRLWAASAVTWADIEAACEETGALAQPA